MLRTAGELKGVTIEAMDGDIGSVQDLFFDDQTWTIRYVVVDTGTWLPGRQVLISPFAFQVVPGASRLRTSLTKDQIKNSPSIDTDRPVDRQREIAFSQYYGYPYYWIGPYRWGDLAYPALPITPAHLPARFGLRGARPGIIGPMTLRDLEMHAIQQSLERHDGDKPAAAEELGISLKTLYNKVTQVGALEKSA